MSTTATLPVVPQAAQGPLGTPVSPLDRLAMRAGLALLLWSRRRAEAPRPTVERPTLAGDARFYMR